MTNERKTISLRDLLGAKLYDDLDAVGWFTTPHPFKRQAFYMKHVDRLTILEKNVSVTEQWIKGSNIELLWENHSKEPQLVGVVINGFSSLVSEEVLAAFTSNSKGGSHD